MIFVQAIPYASQKNFCSRSISAHCAKPNKGFVNSEKTPIHRVETDEKAVISMDVAGYSKDQLEVSIDSHVLSVNGSRTNRLQDAIVLRRRFALKHDIYDEHNISAVLSDGVLELTLSKKPVMKPRKIPISVTESADTLESLNEVVDDDRETPSVLVETVNEDDDQYTDPDSWEEIHNA